MAAETVIRARSIPDRFRRAGLSFTKTPEKYTVDAKTLKTLQAEPMIVVEVIPEEPKEKEKETGEKEKEKKK